MKNPQCIVALCTGRTVAYEARISSIVAGVGLHFKEKGFKPLTEGVTTVGHKLAFIAKLLSKYSASKIVLYDDRHIAQFKEKLAQFNVPYEVIEVEAVATTLKGECC
jgi:hypothetical protein